MKRTAQLHYLIPALGCISALSACSDPDQPLDGEGQSPQVEFERNYSNVISGEWHEGPETTAMQVVAKVGAPDAASVARDDNLGTVIGAYSDGTRVGKYKFVVAPQILDESPEDRIVKDQELGITVQSEDAKVSKSLLAKMGEDAESAIPVIISLSESLEEDLSPRQYFKRSAAMESPEDRKVLKAEVMNAVERRKNEALKKQAGIHRKLQELGIQTRAEDGFWLMNAISTQLTPEQIRLLEAQDYVRHIAYDAPTTATWSGSQIESANHFNAGMYLSAGNDGERANPVTGNNDLTIAILDVGFNPSHPVFKDGSGAASRVKETWNCNNSPCTSGLPAPTSQHGTQVASAAAADATDGQIAGTTAERIARSGVAREAAIIMIEIGNLSALSRGLQRAVASGADVVNESRGGYSVCDGNAGPWDEAVYAAESAGVLVTAAAGNEGPSAVCNLAEAGTVPSALTVAQLDDPGSGSYATVDIHPSSSDGYVSASVNGTLFSTAFTAVDVAVTGHTRFAASSGSSFSDVWGTSFAAPRIAGAGILFRDWAIEMGWGAYSHSPGWLRANLIAMTDRASGASSYRTSAFTKRWGGGRFQLRRYTIDDHPSGLWRWETATYRLSSGQRVQHQIGGSGAEPAGLKLVKAYALTREVNGSNVADIDLYLKTKNCASDGTTLRSDLSRDYKSMVQYGSGAAGEKLCVELYGYHVPAGQTRDVQLVVYYSDETQLR
jgi:hypothetical protein